MQQKQTSKNKLLKLILFLIIFGILTFFYFSFLTVITTDSTGYYRCFDVIRGNMPIQSWQLVRGPTMPLIIYIITTLFGDTSLGFLLGTFIFYLTSIGIGYLLISETIKNKQNKILKTVIWGLFIIFFIFNPLIIGYYHAMLTEFVAMTFTLLIIYLSLKWVSINPLTERKESLIYSILFITLSILMWFLKQPYVIVALIPIFLGTVLSIFKLKNKFNTLWKTVTFILCIVGILFSIRIWDQVFLTKAGGSSPETVNGALSTGLINALSNFREIEGDEKDSFIYEREDTDYRVFKVLRITNKQVKDVLVIPTSTEYSNTKNILLILGTTARKYPTNFVMSYAYNYASMINLVPYNYKTLNPVKRFFRPGELRGENENIGLAIYFRESTFLGGASKHGDQMRHYEMENPSKALPKYVTDSLTSLFPIYLMTFTLLISPILFLIFFIIYITNKSVRESGKSLLYESLILLFGYASLHVLFHSITGATVDRYSIVGYPGAIIGCILLLGFINNKNKNLPKIIV